MEGKETLATHLGLASYKDEQVALLRLDIVDYIVEKAEGKRLEEEAVQRGHLAAQFPGEQAFQDHRDHLDRRGHRDQGHLAL
jgi:hypothetical protein